MDARFLQRLAVFALVLLTSPFARADIIYTFESPQFIAGETTPLLNRAPNINTGPPSFTSSFTASPTANGFVVNFFQPNALFTGNSLFDPAGGVPDALTITFNTLVTEVSFDWASMLAGSLTLISSAGTQSQTGTPQGGAGFEGGAFNFVGSSPFSSITLSALTDAGAPVQFAIDDLNIRLAAPEPATIALLAFALLGLGWSRRATS